MSRPPHRQPDRVEPGVAYLGEVPLLKPETRVTLAEGIQGITKADSPPKTAAHPIEGHTGSTGHAHHSEELSSRPSPAAGSRTSGWGQLPGGSLPARAALPAAVGGELGERGVVVDRVGAGHLVQRVPLDEALDRDL
jgi:hypothetical protein